MAKSIAKDTHVTASGRRHASDGTGEDIAASVDRKWIWYFRQLQRARSRLLRRRQEQYVETEALIEADPIDPSERANEETDLEILISEANLAEQEIEEIDAALERIRKGTYGVCERTGRPIPWERLRAIPWTRYCVEAAADNERA